MRRDIHMSKIKIGLYAAGGLLAVWLGFCMYQYIFDQSKPELMVRGIQTECFYGGDVTCTIEGYDDYKVGTISVFLDDEPLVNKHVINKQVCDYSFPLSTQGIPDGKHTLRVIAEDAALSKNKTEKDISFFVDNAPLRAAFVKSDPVYKVFQGRTLHVQFQSNKPLKQATVNVLSQQYTCIPEAKNSLVYECFVPVSTEENPSEHVFTITAEDAVGNVVSLGGKLQVVMYPFKTQNLRVNSEKLKKEEELGLSERQFEEDIARVSQNSLPEKIWHSAFYVPCDLKGVSTAFGTLRTTHERGKYRHNALDLLAHPKSSVWASQNGRVVIKERYAHSGNTIVLDHGCGVLSMYFHLDSFANINLGEIVKKGKPVGTVGMTGYASGYHLHWELRIYNIPVDPMQWTKHDF